jgi:hypothetical protein
VCLLYLKTGSFLKICWYMYTNAMYKAEWMYENIAKSRRKTDYILKGIFPSYRLVTCWRGFFPATDWFHVEGDFSQLPVHDKPPRQSIIPFKLDCMKRNIRRTVLLKIAFGSSLVSHGNPIIKGIHWDIALKPLILVNDHFSTCLQ